MTFFEENWKRYGTGQKYVAIIPKNVIGKDDTSKIIELTSDTPNSELIQMVIDDKYYDKDKNIIQMFQEHIANKVECAIEPSKFTIMQLPDAREIFVGITYSRETEDGLRPQSELIDKYEKYAISSNLNIGRLKSMIERVKNYWKGLNEELKPNLDSSNLTLQEVGEGALENFKDNPVKMSKAFEALEQGIKTQGKETQTKEES